MTYKIFLQCIKDKLLGGTEEDHAINLSFLPKYYQRKSYISRGIIPSFHSFIYSSILSFILYSALRQVHSLLQSEFSTECDPLLSLSISSILSFH